MTAVTPNASNHAGLPPKASRFVDVPQLPWETSDLFPGIETKTLLFDPANGQVTVLMRLAPGARVRDHEHVLTEQTYMLEGSLVCGEGECKAGQFVWRPSGSRHEAWAGPQGALFIAMFNIPNRFFRANGRQEDFTGAEWEEKWGPVLARHEEAMFV